MKHSRRRACAQYQEFKIRKEDEELILKGMEEDLTLASRSNQSPCESNQLLELIEIINRDHILKTNEHDEKRRELRMMILQALHSDKAGDKRTVKAVKQLELQTPTKTKKLKKLVSKQKKPNTKSKSMKESDIAHMPAPSMRSNRKCVKSSMFSLLSQ